MLNLEQYVNADDPTEVQEGKLIAVKAEQCENAEPATEVQTGKLTLDKA